MPFRQIDLSQISTANSSNNQVIAVVANTIVWANVTASGGSANPLATSIVGLNTANVTESTSNLYFTNARVYSNIVSTLETYTGNIFAGNLTTTGATGGSITGANLLSTNNISSLNWIGLYTANVIETSGNLYFTNARVYSNIVSTLATYNGNINAGNIITGGALGGSLTGANLLSTNNISSLNWIGLYTANVIETASNLYFTNARSRLAISESTGVSYNQSTGAISIGQNVSTTANVTFGQLNVTGNVNFYGNVTTHSSNNLSISDNMIYLNSGSLSSNPDLGFAGNYNDGTYKHTGFFRDATDGVWKVFDSYTPEPDASQFIDTGHASFRLANLSATTFTGNVIGTISSIGNFTTSNLSEGTNLYYTNARVYSNIVSTLATYTGNIFAGNLTTGGATGGSITGANLITSNNITVTTLTATNVNIIGGITDTTGILSITTTGGTNANIELNANGTGRIGLDGMYWPNADGTAGQILQTSGTGDLSWTTPSAGGGGGSGLFNSAITSSNNYLATNTLSSAIVFSTQSILHSVYITNIDTVGSANIGVTATILGGGTNAPMLFNMPLPYRSSFEALKKPKVVNAGDAIQILGLENGVGANNDVHATIVYEEITSGTYTGINSNISIPYENVDIFTAASASIIESVMVSSTNNLGNIPITVTVTNSSNVIQGYMAYTLLVPVGATIELCEKPRRIASGHKIQAYTNAANAIAIFVAAKAV
jgi:hypothetical protein